MNGLEGLGEWSDGMGERNAIGNLWVSDALTRPMMYGWTDGKKDAE